MAFNLENMSIDYKKMFNMVPTQRVEVAQSGVINDFLSALTPGQLVNLFPRYYREQLPDVGKINQYASKLEGALSGGAKYQTDSKGGTYTPMFGMPPSKTAQELAVEDILKQSGIEMKTAPIMRGQTAQILATIRGKESNGNYTTPNLAGASTASGAYQFTDGTWQSLTNQYGIGTEYSRALEAPPEIQDQIAARYVEDILKRHNGDVSWIPREWFAGPDGKFNAKEQRANPGQTVEGYVQDWLQKYNKNADIGNIESAAEDIKKLEDLKAELVPLSEEIRSKLDARTLEIYDKAPPEQKWNMEQAIKAVGVDEFKTRVDRIAKTTNNVGTMAELIVDDASGSRIRESQAGFRKLPIKPELRNAMEYAAEQSGVYIDVFSGGQDKDIHDAMEASGNKSAWRHSVDIEGIPGAADVILFTKDENGKAVPLSTTNSEHAPYIANFVENFSRVTPSAGIGANYMKTNGQVDPRKLHVGGPNAPGAPPATWGQMPDYLAEAHARGVAARAEDLKRDFDPLKEWEIKKEEALLQKAKEEAEAKAQASPVTATQEATELQETNSAPPSLATGGEITPGENIAGINTDTGKVEFMANDREKIRIDPAELENTQQIPTTQTAMENAAKLERPTVPQRERNPQPIPQSLPNPQMFDDLVAGYTAIPPSQIRAANRAKLYGETSSSLVNGHFS